MHGGKARNIKRYIVSHLEEERPDSVIILAGGNDLPTSRNNPLPVLRIANDIMEIGIACKKFNVSNIFISSVLPRQLVYLQKRRKELNGILRNLCIVHNFVFIDNENIILREHILKDGVHLNDSGTILLARNFLNNLNAHT